MNLLRTRIRGLGPFTDASVDLTTIPAESRIVAVVGQNGAGKTTGIELALLGAVYRDLPTRGSLLDLATERGASVESDIALGDGRAVRFRQTVDPVSQSGESSIVDVATGAALTSSTKVTEADRWVREHLPPLDVVTASLFSAQGSAGILEMRPADRKRLLLRVQGIERIERLATQAGERARAAKAERTATQARRDEAERAVPQVDAIALQRATASLATAEIDASQRALEADLARQALAQARVEAAEHATLVAERDRLGREASALRGRALDVHARIQRNNFLLHDADRIREAHAELVSATAAHDVADAASRASGAAVEAKRVEAARQASSVRDFEQRVIAAESALRAAQARYDRHVAAEAQLPALDAASWALRTAEERHEAAEEGLRALQAAQAGRSVTRIGGLRAGLAQIAIGMLAEGPYTATDALLKDDTQAAAETSYPDDIRTAQHAEREARAAVARARTAHAALVSATQGIDADAPAAREAASAQVDDLRGELCMVRQRHEMASDDLAEAQRGLAPVHEALIAAHARWSRATVAVREWPSDVLARLEQATARVEELRAQFAEIEAALSPVQAALDTADQRVEEHGTPATLIEESELRLNARLVEEEGARSRVARARDEVAALRVRIEDAVRGRARLVELDADLARADRELARWSRLAADLGKDGVQALLVDAAGPALSALVNDLLHSCVSTRWTVTIATSRLTKAGEDRETLELRVMDAERGREGPIETYSGGERVLLGEAISLALTVAACRTAGISAPCLVRDESGAALDAEKARAFVAMLRRAAGMVGAARVLLVTHAPAVVGECDHALVVEGGAMRLASIEEVV